MKSMEKIVALSKNRGFIFPGSEIYGGLANSWDYGPLGVELKNNVKKAWWQKFIQECKYNVGIDAAILMNPKVWEASGHVAGFNDPLVDCRHCKTRARADQLIEDFFRDKDEEVIVDGLDNTELSKIIKEKEVTCPNCGHKDFTDVRNFNMMFKTYQGVTEESQSELYLRPETAQGIFVNFKNVQRSTRKKIPFGIGQVGKSFRNEITPGNFTFRTREFEQMELQFFCKPGTDLEWFEYWRDFCHKWLLDLGIAKDNIRIRDHSEDELAFYSVATSDFEFLFPFGWGELWGIADRTDYDLKQHMEHAKTDLTYFDPETNERYIPYVVEPSLGLDRMTLAFMCQAYDEEVIDDKDTRLVMRLHPFLAPIKVAVLPLSKKLSQEAIKVYEMLTKKFNCDYDESASIGRRYRRQDEIGTPFCVTYDFDSLEDDMVTIRDRDTMEQERIRIDELIPYIEKKLEW